MFERELTLSSAEQKTVLERIAQGFGVNAKRHQFQVGDLITPIDEAPIAGAGHPSIVIEVLATPIDTKAGKLNLTPGTDMYGMSLDIRVIRMHDNNNATAFLIESAWYRPWSLPETVAVPADEAAAA